jgi:oleate hydratase
MESVYTLLDIDRGVPEVFGSCYDVRVLLDSTAKMMDGKKLTDIKLPLEIRAKLEPVMKEISGTIVEELLQRYNLI